MATDLLEEKKRQPRDLLGDQGQDSNVLADLGKEAMEGLPGRFGVNVARGAMQLPGLPVEAIFGGGNFLRRQLGLPETRLEDSIAKDWGSEGWLRAAQSVVGKDNLPAPANELERVTDKAGQFVGGSLPFGPSGLVPALTATAGSEVGRATDEAGLTGGYGEFGGALLGGMAPGVVRGATTSIPSAPSLDAIRRAKDAAYAATEREGVIFTPDFLKRLKTDVETEFGKRAYLPENEPGLGGFLRVLEESQGKNATLTHVDKLRKAAGNAAGDFTKPSQQSLAARTKEIIDEALDTAQANEVMTGDHVKAVKLIKEARNLNQRMRLAETIDEAMFQAKNQAASSGTGGNLENAMRQKIKAILNNKKRRASFSPSERRMMEKIVEGSWTQNRLRQVGGFAPSKGFLPAALLASLGIGSVTGGVPAAVSIPSVLGYAAITQGSKRLAEQITERNIARLNANVRLGGQPMPRNVVNDALREMNRRAKLAGKSALPATPGMVTMQTRGYPERPEGYPYTIAR